MVCLLDQSRSSYPMITNSRLKTYQQCQRLHWYQYVLGYRPVAGTPEAEFGTVMHSASEAWYRAHMLGLASVALVNALKVIHDSDLSDIDKIKARVLMTGYDARWSESMTGYEVMAVEAEFKVPVYSSPDTIAYYIAGKIDAIVRRKHDGKIFIVEHKTTGADLSPGSTYWQRLRLEPQVSMYFRGARALGFAPDGCLWDVLVRPEQRLLKATPEEDRKYTKKDNRLYKGQRENDETEEEFHDRLIGLVAESPADWFARAEVVRLPSELEQFEDDVTSLAAQCLAAETHSARNPDACYKFGAGKPCAFVGVCSGIDTLENDSKFRKLDSIHPELAEAI